jgi:hypothetical protein
MQCQPVTQSRRTQLVVLSINVSCLLVIAPPKVCKTVSSFPNRCAVRGGLLSNVAPQEIHVIAVGRDANVSINTHLEEIRVGHNHSQVDVDWRDEAALQLEASKLDSFHLMELQHEAI